MDLVVTLRHKPVLTLLLLRSSFARTVSVGRASASKGAISTLGCWRHVDDPEHSQDMARELQLSWKVFVSDHTANVTLPRRYGPQRFERNYSTRIEARQSLQIS